MNSVKSEITGVILAGGQSRRMGFNKAEADMHGASMLNRMIDKMQQLTHTLIVSVGATPYPNIKLPQIPDEFPQCGPMGGIYSVLKTYNSSLNLVVSCDIPLVSVSLLKYIVSEARNNNAQITVPVDQTGELQMMCAVFRKEVIPILKQQIDSGAVKMKGLLELVSVEYIKINENHPLYDEHAFINVNNPSSLEQVRKLWKERKE